MTEIHDGKQNIYITGEGVILSDMFDVALDLIEGDGDGNPNH